MRDEDAETGPVVTVCTFEVDGALLGVDIVYVQEVIRWQPMTPAPGAPPQVRGLVNLRGQIVTAVDLRVLMGLPGLAVPGGAEPEDLPPNVVVRLPGDDDAVSLLVDAVADVVEVPAGGLEPVPATVDGPLRELLSGACPLPGRLLLLLDPRVVLGAGGE